MNKKKLSVLLSLIMILTTFFVLFLIPDTRVKADTTTYETPDYISVSDLKKNGKSVGNKIVMSSHSSYTYDKKAKYGSVVFEFVLKNSKWSVDDDGGQFHLYHTWQLHGAFWLRPDDIRIAYKKYVDDEGNELDPPKQKYVEAHNPINAGTHNVELGRLAIMDGEEYTGDQYFYIKIDGNLYCEYVISDHLTDDLIKDNGIFLTCTSGNIILDKDWNGNHVTYMSNGEIIKEETVYDDYLTKPQENPTMEGKTFVGWYDEMGREWDFKKNQVTDKLVLRAGFVSNDQGVSDEVYFSDENYNPVLRFMVASDAHIGTSESRRDTNLGNAIDLAYSIASQSSKYKALDALLFAGDISDNGDATALNRFKTIAYDHMNEGTELIISMGNHDFRSNTDEESILNFKRIFGMVDAHLVINGYHFIVLSPNINEGCHFTQDKVEWLDTELEKAVQADPNKPIFVMQHEHIKDTVYGSTNWYVEELTEVLCKYPQVVDFSGHSHYPLTDPRSIWQGTFTALGTGTLHYYEMGINGYKTTNIFPTDHKGGYGTSASEKAAGAEIQIVEIDANNAIRITAYDVNTQTVIARYYIRNAMDEIKFTYSHIEREKTSVAPVFPEGAKLTLTPYKNTITIKFDKAICDDVIDSYRVELYQATDIIDKKYVLADTFFIPNPEEFEVFFNRLKVDSEYIVKVYAVSVWGKETEVPLRGVTRTENVDFDPETYGPYDLINIKDVSYPDNNGVLVDIPSESKQYTYPGESPTHTSVIKFYLLTGNLTSKDEFRIQIGNIWKYYNCFWIQTGKYDQVFLGWIYSTRPTDRYNFAIESNKMYEIEFGVMYVKTGEYEDSYYTYLIIDGKNLAGFYIPKEEFLQDNYSIAFHITDNYKVVDVNNTRTINYYVDNNIYQSDSALSGLNIKEPNNPTKEGYYFAGWYTAKEGGERVDFTQVFESEEKTVNYYARFTDIAHSLKIYSEGELLETQMVGHDCQALKPVDPIKTGTYRYRFVKWVIKGTSEEFNFSSRLLEDTEIEALFEEYRYKITYLVDGVEYVTKYFVESNPEEIIGGEPEVPALFGSTGYWVYSSDTRTNKDIYVRAIYDGIETSPSEEISLNKFNGSKVDIADDLTRFYLSFADTDEQAEWIDSFALSGGHERQNISFSWTDTSRNSEYLVFFADNQEFKNAFIIQTDKRSIDYVGIFIPGVTYYWKVIGLTNQKSSEVDTFTILNSPVRWISSGTVYNVRDIGGWTTLDGNVVKYGMIYRGGQLSLDQSGEVSYMNSYSFKVFDYLGMKTEIELRGDKPHEYNQFNELGNLILVNGNNYMGMFNLNESTKKNYLEVFNQLADESNYPFYFHCSWGADRTGTLGFLINGLLGVPYEQLVEDYELTSLSHSGTRTRYGWSNGAFYNMYQKFLEYAGDNGTLQDGITNYLIDYIGVSEETIASIKRIMLEEASSVLKTHTVTYMIDGEVYQTSKVFDGESIKGIAPFFIDKHLDCWLLDGEPYDSNTKVTGDLVLEARFAPTLYEEYDIVTVRDLGLGDTYTPTAGLHTIEGTATTGGRLFVFDYVIRANDGSFDDGVHVEIGLNTWDYRAHVWFCDLNSIHIFTNGSQPDATYNRHLEYGKAYRVSVGVIIPIDGDYAGKKMFVVMLNDEVLSFLPTTADISSNYNIGLAGTEGVLKSIPNTRSVQFISPDGTVIETKEVVRGEFATEIEHTEIEKKVFLGWFDELGNLWNFETNKILKDTKLFAKYGDRTIDAVILDENDYEIAHGYKVKIGIAVSEIELPFVSDDNLEFDAWYDGDTKLSPTDIINEDMDLICRFKIKETKPIEPVEPDKPKKGCSSFVSPGFYLISLVLIGSIFVIKKKKEERE